MYKISNLRDHFQMIYVFNADQVVQFFYLHVAV